MLFGIRRWKSYSPGDLRGSVLLNWLAPPAAFCYTVFPATFSLLTRGVSCEDLCQVSCVSHLLQPCILFVCQERPIVAGRETDSRACSWRGLHQRYVQIDCGNSAAELARSQDSRRQFGWNWERLYLPP